MEKRRIGPLALRALPLANVVAWLLFLPADDGRTDFARQVTAELIASTAAILFALALLLSTRARFLEGYFGGLDKMYRAHREASIVAFLLLLVHVALIPWRLEPGGGVPAGLIAFAGFLILVVLSLGPRLRVTRRLITLGYRSWKRTHRLIGIFFIFSLAHMFLVRPLIVTTMVPLLLVIAVYVVGIGSYLYGLILARFVRPILGYVVEEVRRINESTVEVVLRPRKKALDFNPGQFVFVRFKARGLREPHPFTVASSTREEVLRLVIKASGDFTRHLYDNLEPGRRAKVEGSYGMLDHRRGRRDQVWIAGGIGITPYLSWLRTSEDLEGQIDFFYAVRRPDEVLFLEDIQDAANRHRGLVFHLNVSDRDGSLTMDKVESLTRGALPDKSVYICGPVRMIDSFERGFRGLGVRPDEIHFEEFSFR